MTAWTDEEIVRQFRLEVQQRFAAENEAYLRREREGIFEIKASLDVKGMAYPEWLVERDSLLWEIYSGSEIRIGPESSNAVTVVTPRGFALGSDFVEMFNGTSVGWSVPSLDTVIVDGESHVVVKITLIDTWDDDRHAAWTAQEERDLPSDAEAIYDPTTAAIVDQIAERDRLRTEVQRLTETVDAMFEKGYDQAVQEIHDHFASRRDIVAEIDEIWKISLQRRIKIS